MVIIARVLYVSEFNQGIEGMQMGHCKYWAGRRLQNLEILNSEALLTSVSQYAVWMGRLS